MGTTYSNWVTVGFEPEKIQPTVPYPKDFVEYWEGQKEIADRVPLDVEMQLLPDRCTAKVNVYEVSYAVNKSGARFYGFCVYLRLKVNIRQYCMFREQGCARIMV